MKRLGLAACAAFALSATAASAGGYWQNGTYYSYPSATTTQSTTTYGTSVTGSVGPIQNGGTVTYSQPAYTAPSTVYVAPATTSTYYTSPTTYAVPSTSSTTYYTRPTTTYVSPPTTTYAPVVIQPPAYYQPGNYDATERVRTRIQRQRDRIENALARGDLRRGEERRLRENLRDIRQSFREYRRNDGYIGRYEEAELMRKLDDNSRRIYRLANNHRTAGGHGHNPGYGYRAY